MDLVREFNEKQVAGVDRPRLQPGDVVRVTSKVTEGEKTRLQTFEGTVLSVRGSGPSVTFTVRREVNRFGVERIFPLFSPLITGVEIVKRQKVRRAKLNYLREMKRRRVKEDEKSMKRHEAMEEQKRRQEEEKLAKEKAEKEKEENSNAESTPADAGQAKTKQSPKPKDEKPKPKAEEEVKDEPKKGEKDEKKAR